MAKRYYEAAGGVVVDDGQMLLLDRPLRGEVRLPKGHIELGETAEVAALRETAEESGYDDLEVVDDLGSQVVEFTIEGEQVRRVEHYFLMRLGSHRQMERSKQDAAQFQPIWIPLAEAPAHLTYQAEQETARRAIDAYLRQA